MWKVFDSQDGTTSVLSEHYGVSYHSRYGALQESRHVFIEAGMFYKSIEKKDLSILEMGFGTGLNALLTCLEAERLGVRVAYTALELHPLPASILSQLNYREMLGIEPGNDPFTRIHQAAWNQKARIHDFFTLQKIEMDFHAVTGNSYVDVIYFDAFAPNVQPDLWEEPLIRKMYEALVPGGILVTYCAKGSFKRVLREVGFTVEAIKGPPGKREMTRAHKENHR